MSGVLKKIVNCLDGLVNERAMGALMVRKYMGYMLVYSRGTSLIEHIRLGRPYEKEIVGALLMAIRERRASRVLDIGANIGLVTLACLAESPDVRVYAFEPGLHQRKLLEETVKLNDLWGRVEVYPMALSNSVGNASFAVHEGAHASGDGLLDTGRAGASSTIMVDVTTLDEWWKSAGSPDIPVAKIDVEGAEKWLLEGGIGFLSACRPTLVIEIWPDNERPYGYGPDDVFFLLKELGYRLETPSGTSMDDSNRRDYWGKETTFIAKPSN